ncbi:MAG: DoxX family protein [Actinomycetota bacterium]|nr:DoxX family protein [Actinomycetota bacterium]
MKAVGSSAFGRAADLGPLFLRVGVGSVFAWHGWQKFDGGVSNFAGFLDSLGVPLPEVVAWLQVVAEGVGGLMLILGLFTRFVAVPLIAISIGAIYLVKVNVGFIVPDAAGAELDVALLGGELALLFLGPGRVSLDAMFGMETSATHLDTGRRRPPVAA